ncbi:MAG: AAA family ATPase, partial [Bacteroidota bacterium]
MEKLRVRSNERIRRTTLDLQRDELQRFDWDARLLGIKGARGIGKTTLLLQHLKQTYGLGEEAIYISLDDIFFAENRLIDVVETFYRGGGQCVYI